MHWASSKQIYFEAPVCISSAILFFRKYEID